MTVVDLPWPGQERTGANRVSVRVFEAGLACCAVEVAAALRRLAPGVMPEGAAGEPVSVLLVAGTVTDKLAPYVVAEYERMPEPRCVLSFGACSNSGGPYWDSYCVTKGVDRLLPVHAYVPGCPPRPEALEAGLAELLKRRGGEPGAGAGPGVGDGERRGAGR